jgi:hypothetical protein
MRESIRFLALAAAVATAAMASAQGTDQGNDITVTLNGSTIHFRGQGPVMSQDRVFVPLRGVFQKLGAHVDWDPSTQTVSADRGPTHVRLTIGNRTASINGQPTSLDLPAQIIEGSTMVPLRFVSEALGANVDWNEQDQTVLIAMGDYKVRHDGAIGDNTAMVGDGGTRGDAGTRPMRLHMPNSLPAGTIIQASLITDVNSNTNRRGDRIMANVTDESAGLPQGTRLQGRVTSARIRTANQPGWLSLAFDTLILPNGNTVPVSGTFTGIGRVGSDWVHNAHFKPGTAFGVRLINPIRFHN